jgi:hypothetical protein
MTYGRRARKSTVRRFRTLDVSPVAAGQDEQARTRPAGPGSARRARHARRPGPVTAKRAAAATGAHFAGENIYNRYGHDIPKLGEQAWDDLGSANNWVNNKVD